MGRFILIISIVLTFSCNSEDSLNSMDLEFWIGDYEVQVIDGDEVNCSTYIPPEIISLTGDNEFEVINSCSDHTLAKGEFDFVNGVFYLDPEVGISYEMFIFIEEDDIFRIYNCLPGSGNCSIRMARKIL